MLTTVIIKLRDTVKEWDGITVHDKDKNLVTLIKGGAVETAECTEADAKSYVANYGHLLETVTPDDLNKQVHAITAFLKKKFPKEFGNGQEADDEEGDKDQGDVENQQGWDNGADQKAPADDKTAAKDNKKK